MSEKMSITRALTEIKLLDSRITKKIQNGVFCDITQEKLNGKTLITKIKVGEFEERLKSSYQSVEDLIYRRNRIKSKILMSNSKTEVEICGKKYSVVQAIEKKDSIKYEKMLLNRLKQNYVDVKNNIDSNNTNINSQILTMLNQSLGTDTDLDEKAFDKISKPFLEANELKKVDPLNIEKKINDLEDYIDGFENEVDFVLAESNARTEIEI